MGSKIRGKVERIRISLMVVNLLFRNMGLSEGDNVIY